MTALAVDLFAHAALSVARQVSGAMGAPPCGQRGRGRSYAPLSEAIYIAVVMLGAQKTAVARAAGVHFKAIPRTLARVEDARDRADIERRLGAIEAAIYGGQG